MKTFSPFRRVFYPGSWLTVLLALGFATRLEAATLSNVLSLERAIEIAEQQSPDLAEARAQADAARGRADQAGVFPNPEAVARVESAPFKGRTAGEAEYVAGVSQTIPLGSRLDKARQAEQRDYERRSQEIELPRRELRRRVHGAFAIALFQERAFELQSELSASAEKLVRMARARFEAGDALREDIARAEMERARVRVEHRRVEALREQARARLAAEMGEPAAATLPLEGSLFSTFDVPAIEEVAANLASHPAVTGAASDVRARVARLELAQAERIPDVKVEVLYRRLAGEQENAFDVGASIPLPIFDRNRGRLREARAEVAAAEARARATRSALDLSLRETYAQLGAALANSRMLQAEVLPNAEVVRKTAEARYAVGDLGLAEVLSVRRDWASAQLTCLESLRDVMQAWAALGPFLKPN